jgi:hypothetical protein
VRNPYAAEDLPERMTQITLCYKRGIDLISCAAVWRVVVSGPNVASSAVDYAKIL